MRLSGFNFAQLRKQIFTSVRSRLSVQQRWRRGAGGVQAGALPLLGLLTFKGGNTWDCCKDNLSKYVLRVLICACWVLVVTACVLPQVWLAVPQAVSCSTAGLGELLAGPAGQGISRGAGLIFIEESSGCNQYSCCSARSGLCHCSAYWWSGRSGQRCQKWDLVFG